jgi:RND family efflux transporter MFP subunit
MMFMNLNISRLCYSAGLMSLAISLFTTCSTKDSNKSEAETFLVIHPIITDTAYATEYVADIHSIQNTELRAKVGGYLEAIHADEGQYVKAGQLLFTISRQLYQQELLKANAALASAIAETKAAEVERMNAQALVEKNIVSQSELDLAIAKVEAFKAKTEEARANETSAQLQLSYAQVKAPFSGYINRIPNKVGSLIEEGELLTTISNNEEMLVYFNVSEKEYLDYALAQVDGKPREVSLILANDKIYPLHGKVETTESEIDKSTGSIAFRARFTNPDHILKHGSSGKIRVNTELKNVMLVPQKSTFEIQENLYVFLVDEHNKVSMRKIVPSLYLSHYYVINSGLSSEDRFILEGIQRVRPGDTIVPEGVSLANVNQIK